MLAVYNLKLYDVDPASILTTTIGSTFSWTGPYVAEGRATVTDNETGIQGTTLDDDSAGKESATANVVIGGSSSTGSSVDAENVWTV